MNELQKCKITLGKDIKIYEPVSIGYPAQMGFKGDKDGYGEILIGDNTIIREFCTINAPWRETKTIVGNNCYLMATAHIGHDAKVGNGVIVGTHGMVGGGSRIEDGVFIGLNVSIHQKRNIGEYSIIGMNTPCTYDIPPFLKVAGNPVRILGINYLGMERAGLSQKQMNEIKKFYDKILFNPSQEKISKMQSVSLETQKILDFLFNNQKPLLATKEGWL